MGDCIVCQGLTNENIHPCQECQDSWDRWFHYNRDLVEDGASEATLMAMWGISVATSPPACDVCEGTIYSSMVTPMVRDEIWNVLFTPDSMVCMKCTEQRLGRPLALPDLTPCMLSAEWVLSHRGSCLDTPEGIQFFKDCVPREPE